MAFWNHWVPVGKSMLTLILVILALGFVFALLPAQLRAEENLPDTAWERDVKEFMTDRCSVRGARDAHSEVEGEPACAIRNK
jgi:hypothetical protein